MKLCLVIREKLQPKFFRLMQQGFVVSAESGCSIKSLLCRRYGIGADYLQNRIQTLLLDGKPVDDVEKAYIHNDATLALSGAMPGLVGATLRRGGALAAMRNTISYSDARTPHEQGAARVKIKLFNMILKELGPIFLESGVLISREPLQEFLSRNRDSLRADCLSIQLNDRKIDAARIETLDWSKPEVFLQVTIAHH